MSGFLQALAARESGIAAVLGPRVPGWFEPPAAHGPGAALLPLSSPAQHTSLDSADDDSSDAAPPSVPHFGAPQRNAVAAADPAPRRDATPPPAPRAALPLTRPEAPLEGVLRVPATPPQVPAPLMTVIPIEAAPLPPRAPPRAAEPAQAGDPPEPVPRNERLRPRAALLRVQEESLAGMLEPQAPAIAARSARLAPGALLAAQAGEGRRTDPGAPPQPVIQVTIGRLEVRAIQPSQAPPAPRPRQSPTTLEDYLAQRNGAGRR